MASELPRAVTFDCWNTLIYEADPLGARRFRSERLQRALSAEGLEHPLERVERALSDAWQRHNQYWLQGVQWGGDEIARAALEALGARADTDRSELIERLEDAALEHDVRALEGARETLERLAERGVPLALICDTGFTPGRVVRALLERHGLLAPLAVAVFSDEVGAPKPDPRPFAAALEHVGVPAASALHVGDLLRTDVAGARGAGMRSARIRHVHDDSSDHPEADWVVDHHAELRARLGL